MRDQEERKPIKPTIGRYPRDTIPDELTDEELDDIFRRVNVEANDDFNRIFEHANFRRTPRD